MSFDEAPAYVLANVIRETDDEVGTLLLVGQQARQIRSTERFNRELEQGVACARADLAQAEDVLRLGHDAKGKIGFLSGMAQPVPPAARLRLVSAR